MPHAADAPPLAHGIVERLGESNGDVFDRVMVVDVQVAAGPHV